MGLFKKENLLKLFTHVKAPKDMEDSGQEIVFTFNSKNQTFMKWVVGRNGDVVEVPYNQTVCEVPLLKVADKELNKHAEKLIQKAAEHSSNRIWANERFVKISGVKYAIAPADDLGIFCDGGKLGKGLIITNTSAVRKVAL